MATPTDNYAIAVAFSADGRRLLWREQLQGRVGLWNVDALRAEPIDLFAPANLAFFPDADHLLQFDVANESDRSNLLRITDVKSGDASNLRWARVPRIVKELDIGRKLFLDSDQQWPVIAGGNLTVWDLSNRRLVLALPREDSPINALTLSRDHSQVAVGLTDGTINIWNLPQVRSQLATIGLDW